ncbi:hypothetical protein ASG11_17905 [Sphingomonas sp. Leaf357]|uniref:rhomboid family intramembrane serine protease n=1 Tax=Sphingomonas sp. Leaf357 TaxID=1736350 RepID=UPI0006F73C7D|nr:rhomboid family intramembrane serine protease [Sphingomonas sp. Leaf357]KQS01527.1 hypothetical protein ASG11_17905 [Sphingomonas sp. Leaf357]
MAESCRRDAQKVEEPQGIDISWHVPWHARVPGAALIAIMTLLWLGHIRTGGMGAWGVSGAALADGRWRTVPLHMFAHGGAAHILMNGVALFVLGGPLVARMGDPPLGWPRFVALFLASGLAGMALFLAIHPYGVVPMLGASGAIYGLLGLLIRLPVEGEALMPIRSARTRKILLDLVKANAWLVVLLAIPALLLGQSGGLAWEAHLGGFLFGLFAGPWFLPGVRTRTD